MLDRIRLEASAKLNRQKKLTRPDLRMMKYPSRDTLISLGRCASRQGELSQEGVENRVRRLGMVSLLSQENHRHK